MVGVFVYLYSERREFKQASKNKMLMFGSKMR
jgi:hypothetical protein